MTDIDEWLNDIHVGDARETLADLPESSVHMMMTSPPYFGLRDYDADGQIGLEDSLDEYIAELVGVFREVRRVLRPDGSAWLNLGDSYATSRNDHTGGDQVGGAPESDYATRDEGALGRKNKMLVPHRVAIALQADGWVVRNDVTWVKPNPMPSSVTDRLTTSTEQVFHLVPEPDYWYDLDAVREPYAESSRERYEYGYDPDRPSADVTDNPQTNGEEISPNTAGKNPGDVFEVTTKPFPEAHFAVYPPELCETPIKATCPPRVCADCGTPYERRAVDDDTIPMPNTGREQGRRALERFEESDLSHQHLRAMRAVGFTDAGQAQEVYDGHGNNEKAVERLAAEAKDVLGGYAREFLGEDRTDTEWVQGCDCDTDATEAGIALDPFAGAGTTCRVAKDLGRRFIGIDLNPDYVAMAQKRVGVTVDEPDRLLDDDGATTLEAFTDGGGES
jgi:DNA modification methylase